jgi:succinyl-diaminopimelate desuccinylase
LTANPLPVALIINGKRKDRSIHYRQKMVNRFGLIRLTQKLISIDSENPPGDESRIAAFVRDYLRRLGLKVEIYQFQKNRPNVLAYFLTKGAKHSLLLSPHLDTVPAGKSWTKDPFSGAIIKKKIYGLGATDCKGNLACALETLKSLVEEKVSLRYNLIFAATADEECGSTLGLVPLLEKRILRPDAALVLDAEEFEVIIAQKGLVHLRVKIQGRRAHGAYPWRGVNAISITLDILQALKFFKFRQRKHSYLRPPTINIGTIRGGDKVNVVADHCEFELDFRFLPGESPAGLVQELKYLIQKYVRNFKVELMSIQQPYSIDKSIH